jgi:hypothetical protein
MDCRRVALWCAAISSLGAGVAWAEPKPGFLGAWLGDSDRESVSGALVREVFPDTPAAAAKLQVQDIVTSINGVRVDSGASLVEQVGKRSVGDKVTLKVIRKGEEKEIPVTLGGRPIYSLVLSQKNPPRVPGGANTMAGGGGITGSLTMGANLVLDGHGVVEGDLTLEWTALAAFDLDKQGVLDVTGKVSLAGILYVELSAKPNAGDRFELIRNAAALRGTFGKTMLPKLPEGLEWEIVYDDLLKKTDLDGDGKYDVTLVVRRKANP